MMILIPGFALCARYEMNDFVSNLFMMLYLLYEMWFTIVLIAIRSGWTTDAILPCLLLTKKRKKKVLQTASREV